MANHLVNGSQAVVSPIVGRAKTSVRSARAIFSKLFRAGFEPCPRFDLHRVFDFIAVVEMGEQHAGANEWLKPIPLTCPP